MAESKHKSSSDIAGTAKEWQEPRKAEERQEEVKVTGKPKEIHDAGNGEGFSWFREALSVFEARDLNTQLYTRVAAAVQNAIQGYRVICDENKELLARHNWIVFSRG